MVNRFGSIPASLYVAGSFSVFGGLFTQNESSIGIFLHEVGVQRTQSDRNDDDKATKIMTENSVGDTCDGHPYQIFLIYLWKAKPSEVSLTISSQN